MTQIVFVKMIAGIQCSVHDPWLVDDILPELQQDMLVKIVEAIVSSTRSYPEYASRNLCNLRLADKQFHAAVSLSAIRVHPCKDITSGQLIELGRLFRNASSLDLSRCHLLGDEDLRGLAAMFPHLRLLDLSNCPWLSTTGVAHLEQLSRLESLLLTSFSSPSLPKAISGLASLQHLDLWRSELWSLAKELTALTSLRKLSLISCHKLGSLPEGIGALSLLQRLDLDYCWVLTELPNSISGLASLEHLAAKRCPFTNLPSAIGSLSALTFLDLCGCYNLEDLPETLGGLASLEILRFAGCASLAALPSGISRLSALRMLD